MKDLVIGNTSQISHLFTDDNVIKISSRDFIGLNNIKHIKWNNVYMCFGESRKTISDIEQFERVNYNLTIDYVNFFKSRANKVIVFGTCELWNKYIGPIGVDYDIQYFKTPYLNSKNNLVMQLRHHSFRYPNVVIVHPFNFNSTYRGTNFLFGKVFDSIINKKQIEIGDTYFHRDMITPKYLYKKLIEIDDNSPKEMLVGSGNLIFVNDLIRDLYKHFDMKYEDYVKEDLDRITEYPINNEYYLKIDDGKPNLTYQDLLEYTVNEIKPKRVNP